MAQDLIKGKEALKDDRRTIFLVDRSESFLMYLRILLERMGFRVIPLKKGGLLKDLMQVIKPDLVLMGTVLDDMEGFSLLQDLKKDDLFSQIPVVMICRPEDEELIRDNRELGHVGYLSRPVNIFRLYKVVNDIIIFKSGEKRKHLRTSFLEQVTITHSGKTAKYWATSLSEGGIYIRSRVSIPLDEEVFVEIPLGFDTPLKIQGRVIYFKQSVIDSGPTEPGMAIQFSSVSPEQASQLRVCILGLLVGDLLEEQDEPVLSLVSRTNDLFEEIVLEHIRVGRELKSYQLELKKMIEALPMGIVIYSLDSSGELSIVSSNPAAERLLGVSARQLDGKVIIAPNMGELGFLNELKHICADGGMFERINVKYQAEKGDRFFDFLAFQSSPGKVVVVLNDATYRKKIEEERLRWQKLESVGQLAGGIAHDFNNMLTAIIGYASFLGEKIGTASPLKPYVDQILSASEKSANLTKQLLAFSRKQILSPQVTDLNELIIKMGTLLKRLIGEDIEFKTLLADKLLTAMVDTGQIEQVLLNLCTNARDAMPHGGLLTISTDVLDLDKKNMKTHGLDQSGRYALISVTDNGIGLDEIARQKIFEPFFTTKEIGKGTGLGLAIVYGIIKQHNGYITVYSEPGKGTTFNIYLPLIESPVEEASVKEVIAPIGGTETILVTEDNSEVRALISYVLQEFGYTVIEAVDGDDAINKFEENKDRIELAILDIIMPKKSGKEASEAIRNIKPNLKILFISGYTADIITKAGINEEGGYFIQKPISPQGLLWKVREILDKKEQSVLLPVYSD
jgi:signal transduction histidine kinase/DNA-binding response OmpR family regulator